MGADRAVLAFWSRAACGLLQILITLIYIYFIFFMHTCVPVCCSHSYTRAQRMAAAHGCRGGQGKVLDCLLPAQHSAHAVPTPARAH